MKKLIIPLTIFIIAFSSIHLSSQSIDSIKNNNIQKYDKELFELKTEFNALKSFKEGYIYSIAIVLGFMTLIIGLIGFLTYLITTKRIEKQIEDYKKLIDKQKEEYESDKKELDDVIGDTILTIGNFNSAIANLYISKDIVEWSLYKTVSLVFNIKYVERIKDISDELYVQRWIKDVNNEIDNFIDEYQNKKGEIKKTNKSDSKSSLLHNLNELINIKTDIFRNRKQIFQEIYKEIEN